MQISFVLLLALVCLSMGVQVCTLTHSSLRMRFCVSLSAEYHPHISKHIVYMYGFALASRGYICPNSQDIVRVPDRDVSYFSQSVDTIEISWEMLWTPSLDYFMDIWWSHCVSSSYAKRCNIQGGGVTCGVVAKWCAQIFFTTLDMKTRICICCVWTKVVHNVSYECHSLIHFLEAPKLQIA